ncbi:hypothetical protein JI747_020160 [Chryseobacterium sp. RG1]|uniref:Lipoprotein n=1 Tax=Chryseobacterium tagetis TaxID=2801334 RepID=A0ABS8A9M9_9FLAO|nr:hypothetical protein [Chryseobacterium tagetis]MCA6069481.1 hypothetical protein [Chryseobacterium tagetis]
MKTKIISWLSYMAVLAFLLQSCRNDDLISPAEKETSQNALLKEGSSLSLWKEDETYIRKVQEVYAEYANENYIRSIHGTILWQYAMTMDTFNESYLIAPVVKDGKVVKTLEVFRVKSKVYFQFSDKDPEANDFFQTLVFTEREKISASSVSENKAGTITTTVCKKYILTVGYVEGAGGEQYPIQETKTICKFVEVALPASDCLGDVDPVTGECGGGGTGGAGGYNYPDPPDTDDDPCETLKNQNLSFEYKEKMTELKKNSVLSQKKESGYSESKSGLFTNLLQATSTDESDGLTVPVSPDTKGYIHTHLNDYETGDVNVDGLPIIKQPIRMFSPADVNTLMTMAEMATDGDYSQLYGTMVSSYGNYTIMFTGTASDIKTGFGTSQWREDYKNYRKLHDRWTFEKLFLTFLKDKMNVDGIELYKIKSNGIVQKKTLDPNNSVQSNDCPQ